MPVHRLGDPNSRFAIRTRDLAVTLGGVDILLGANAEFVHGGINAVIGSNGAGKTTLVKAILGLVPYRGVVELRPRPDGKPPQLAYVPQRVDFDRGTPMSVCDLLCADRQRRPLFLGHAARAVRAARSALDLVGATRLIDAPLGKLSGGEFQRVLLALALLSEPEIVLLDEPVAGVDVAGEQMFCDLLVKLRDERKLTIIMVSHDMSIVVQHTDHVVCMADKVVNCQGDTLLTLTAANIQRIFGFHAAIYDHDHADEGAPRCDHKHHPGHHHPHMPRPSAPPDGGGAPDHTHGPHCDHGHGKNHPAPPGDAGDKDAKEGTA